MSAPKELALTAHRPRDDDTSEPDNTPESDNDTLERAVSDDTPDLATNAHIQRDSNTPERDNHTLEIDNDTSESDNDVPERVNDIPELAVCARTQAEAESFIAELCGAAGDGAVWHISNKYYQCDVRLRALADGAEPARAPEGLLVLLARGEGAEEAARRAAAAPAAAVRVLAVPELCAPLRAAAVRLRLAAVSLRSEGVAEVREALQAHAWPGLRRAPPARAEEDEAAAERWAAALGALGPAAAAVRELRGEERLAAAEHVLEAFCAALGETIDDL